MFFGKKKEPKIGQVLYTVAGREKELLDERRKTMLEAQHAYHMAITYIWEREQIPLIEGIDYKPLTGQFVLTQLPAASAPPVPPAGGALAPAQGG